MKDLKVGDKVRLKTREELIEEFGVLDSQSLKGAVIMTPVKMFPLMQEFCGKTLTIESVDGLAFNFHEDRTLLGWEMPLECIKEIVQDEL